MAGKAEMRCHCGPRKESVIARSEEGHSLVIAGSRKKSVIARSEEGPSLVIAGIILTKWSYNHIFI